MTSLNWDEKYSLNVKEIDDEHKNLFTHHNRLQEGIITGKSQDDIKTCLADLIDHTILHFVTEEKLMQQFSYIGFVEHKRTHDNLITEAKELQEKFSQGKIALSEKDSIFLSDWLTDHILDTDKKYAPLFKSNGVS